MYEFHLNPDQEKRARELHQSSTVIDICHTSRFDASNPIVDGKEFIERAFLGGLNIASQSLIGSSEEDFRAAIKEINQIDRLITTHPDKFMLVTTATDIEKAKEMEKIGLILGFQNATPLENDWLNILPVFFKLGIRIIQITYNERNLLGSGCLESNDTGLTAYGAQVVRALNRYGIMIDLSHVGDRTSADVIELSGDPVLFTHANPRKLNSSPRNKPDDLLKACAEKGGIIGVVAWAVIAATCEGIPPTIEDYFAHIDYLVNLVGIDHVAIGTDINESYRARPIRSAFEQQYSFMLGRFGEMVAPGVDGLHYVHDLPNITRVLVHHGYSDEDVSKILGGNFIRVAKQIWSR